MINGHTLNHLVWCIFVRFYPICREYQNFTLGDFFAEWVSLLLCAKISLIWLLYLELSLIRIKCTLITNDAPLEHITVQGLILLHVDGYLMSTTHHPTRVRVRVRVRVFFFVTWNQYKINNPQETQKINMTNCNSLTSIMILKYWYIFKRNWRNNVIWQNLSGTPVLETLPTVFKKLES